MLSNERHRQIISYLEQKNTVTVQELTDILYASSSTIRRDLSELEAQGFVKRIHGGAVLTAGSTFDTPASLRRTQQLAEKQRIAELASQFLKPSSTYFFDSSSTASILATRLSDYPDVKIATNGVAILSNMQSTDKLSNTTFLQIVTVAFLSIFVSLFYTAGRLSSSNKRLNKCLIIYIFRCQTIVL